MYGRISLFALAAMLALPAGAQVATTLLPPSTDSARDLADEPGHDKQTPKHDAVDAQEKPVTEQLNTSAAVQASGNRAAIETVNAQHEADMASYRAEVQKNAQIVATDEARYERQQRAYADAMAAWREQKRACDKGKVKACEAPTPNPAAFY